MNTNEIATKADLEQIKVAIEAMLKDFLQQSNVGPKKWLKNSDLQQMFGLSPSGLQQLRRNGTLTFTKLSGTILYDPEIIAKILKASEYNGSN